MAQSTPQCQPMRGSNVIEIAMNSRQMSDH